MPRVLLSCRSYFLILHKYIYMKLNVVEEPSQEKGPYKRRRRFKGVGEIVKGPVI